MVLPWSHSQILRMQGFQQELASILTRVGKYLIKYEKWSFRWQSCDMMQDIFFCFYTNVI